MKEKKSFGPKQVGERIRERRTELKLSMPELGKRLGVNKSTIQRYEADGVDPKRTMIIDGLAHALLTTSEWLTGLSEDKEYNSYTVCQMDLEKHVKDYLETLTASVKGEPHQQLLTTFLGQLVDLYAVLAKYWALSMTKIDGRGAKRIYRQIRHQHRIHHGAGLPEGNGGAHRGHEAISGRYPPPLR